MVRVLVPTRVRVSDSFGEEAASASSEMLQTRGVKGCQAAPLSGGSRTVPVSPHSGMDPARQVRGNGELGSRLASMRTLHHQYAFIGHGTHVGWPTQVGMQENVDSFLLEKML